MPSTLEKTKLLTSLCQVATAAVRLKIAGNKAKRLQTRKALHDRQAKALQAKLERAIVPIFEGMIGEVATRIASAKTVARYSFSDNKSVYGYCPQCGAPGVSRERRPDGNDTCKNGHVYPSRTAKAFCPTGPGGGIDNSCGRGSSSGGYEIQFGGGGTPGEQQDELNRGSQVVFGRKIPAEEYAAMAGAPDGARVRVTGRGDDVGNDDDPNVPAEERYIPPNTVMVSWKTDTADGVRYFRKDSEGKPYCINDNISVSDRGKGIGTQSLLKQAEACAKAGVDRIEAQCAKSNYHNGYYTWARLGYDAPIGDWSNLSREIRREFPQAQSLSDIISTSEGRKWWKENGTEFHGTFDLKSGSKSLAVLRAYAQEKGLKSVARYTFDADELTEADDELLDEIWRQVIQTGLYKDKAFCPTGPGGGIDNSCSPHGGRDSDGGSDARVLFEVAPDPNDKELSARWNALSSADKLAISRTVADKILPKVFEAAGVEAKTTEQFGGYLDDTNPSFAAMVPDNYSAEQVLDIAKMSGFALSQDSMMVVREEPFEGADKVGFITVELPSDATIEDVHDVYKQLRTIDDGVIQGHTTVGGEMLIVDFSGDSAGLAEKVNAKLGNKHTVSVDDGYVSFPQKKDYDYASSERPPELAEKGAVARGLREEAGSLIREEIGKREARNEGSKAVKPFDLRKDARSLIRQSLDANKWHKRLVEACLPIMAMGMGEAAMSEVLLTAREASAKGYKARSKKPKEEGNKATTATAWLNATGNTLPPGISTEWPPWLIDNVVKQLRGAFAQPYWAEIVDVTTRDDIADIIEEGLREGQSTTEIAANVREALGSEYYHGRARNIARTETGGALNGGRKAAIEALQEELGPEVDLRAMWLSILGDTTRDAHANLDGVPADENGMWNLNGIDIPYPGHHSLPPGDRCNCYCTIVSELGMDDETAAGLIDEYNQRVIDWQTDSGDFAPDVDVPDAKAFLLLKGTRKFGCVMLMLPEKQASMVRAMGAEIDDADLAEDGREDDSHVTVKFGLHTTDANDVREVVAGYGPVTVEFGKLSLFRNEDADVLKINMSGEGLYALNAAISDELECTDTHPKYEPHCTIAYLKPGKGAKYVRMLENTLAGTEVTINKLLFSDSSKNKHNIPLTGSKAFCPTGEGGGIDNSCGRGSSNDADYGSQYAKWMGSLTPGQRTAFKSYLDKGYKRLRKCMLKGSGCDDKTTADIELMKSALETAPRYHGEVYRGMNFSSEKQRADFIARLKRDGELADPGIMSTSTNRKTADKFMQNAKDITKSGNGVTLVIKTKSGVAMSQLSKYDEDEVVLPPSTKLKMTGMRKTSKGVSISLEEV